jgi:hypothetical protein
VLMRQEPPTDRRAPLTRNLSSDLVVVGGGLAGVCCALTAARAGVTVTLIQDRPVLGGNGSSEVRLWVLGATSHMNSNNRWAREGGMVDEILVENLYRNPEGNPLIFDTILLEKVVAEPNITLLLNTAVYEVQKADADHIESVSAFCSQNSTMYRVSAPLFCDASGDGVVGFLAGAAFRMGAESRHEFGEGFAPDASYGALLGHSIYFYSKDVGKPARFVPPAFALDDITKIPRFRSFNANDYGCRLWWIEYGGRLDTVHDTEQIKWELWKVVYGVWNYIKNSGKFPEAETLTLEWVGHIPGKRESRRFEGPYMLRQQDVVEQRHHYDAVSFGGWSIDLHPADGIFSERPGASQWHAAGVYQVPYRSMYSRNIANLFLAGRSISASHVAFGSTRVMATCAHAAQAVGIAAALCKRNGVLPAAISDPERVTDLQRELQRCGQHIPGFRLDDPADLVRKAMITASSTLRLASLPPDGPLLPLKRSLAQLLPLRPGPVPTISCQVHAEQPTTLRIELRTSSRADNHTPNVVLGTRTFELEAGTQQLRVDFQADIDVPRYAFFCLMSNEHVAVQCSNLRITGLVTVEQRQTQSPPDDIGIESFEMWAPSRRPNGHNLALTIEPPLNGFDAENVTNGVMRPVSEPNAWVAQWGDKQPELTLKWLEPQKIGRIELSFDTDFDHALETVLLTHPENVLPFCVKHYQVYSGAGELIAEHTDNHQTRNTIELQKKIVTDRLVMRVVETWGEVPAALFGVRCYEE